jgi:hypothetical protein
VGKEVVVGPPPRERRCRAIMKLLLSRFVGERGRVSETVMSYGWRLAMPSTEAMPKGLGPTLGMYVSKAVATHGGK